MHLGYSRRPDCPLTIVGLPMDGPRYSHGLSNEPSVSMVTNVVRVIRNVRPRSLSQSILSVTSS